MCGLPFLHLAFLGIFVCVYIYFFKFFFIIYLNSSQYIASDNT